MMGSAGFQPVAAGILAGERFMIAPRQRGVFGTMPNTAGKMPALPA